MYDNISQMKICIATHHFPPNYYAGAEQYAYRLARFLMKKGHQVEVVTIESITQGNLEVESNRDFYEDIPVHRLSFNLSLAKRPISLRFRNPFIGKWFRQYFASNRPDLLHINSGYLLTGAVIDEAYSAGIPMAITLHEYWFLCPLHILLQTNGTACTEPVPPGRCKWCLMGEKRRFRLMDQISKGLIGDAFVGITNARLLNNLWQRDTDLQDIVERRQYLLQTLQKVDLVISPSQFLIDKLKEYGFHHENIVQQPLGLQNLPPEKPLKRRKDGVLRVGYIGRISKEKGVELLVHAFKALPQEKMTLDIYGGFDLEERYDRELHKLASGDSRIQIRGRFNQSELGNILATLDVTVVPSRWYENRPTTILESFAYGTPVIAARFGGMIELIDDQINGLFFELNDAGDLAKQLQRLVKEPQLLPCLELGIPPVPGVDDEMMMIEAFYQNVLHSKSPNARNQ
jgi:glycosyltransferase involved in cell wall biosynthesis